MHCVHMDMSSVSFEIIYTFAFIIVLVPTGTVHSYIYYMGTLHSNNEFDFEIIYFIALNFS